jgi:hypothetical protein
MCERSQEAMFLKILKRERSSRLSPSGLSGRVDTDILATLTGIFFSTEATTPAAIKADFCLWMREVRAAIYQKFGFDALVAKLNGAWRKLLFKRQRCLDAVMVPVRGWGLR